MLIGNFFPFSEDLDKGVYRPGLNSKDPTKSRPHSLALDMRWPSHALTQIALLAEFISVLVSDSTTASVRQAMTFPITERESSSSLDCDRCLFSLSSRNLHSWQRRFAAKVEAIVEVLAPRALLDKDYGPLHP